MDELKTIGEKVLEVMTHTFLEVEIWRIVIAGIILIVTFAVRKLAINLLIALLKKVTEKTKTDIDDRLVEAIDPPARLIVIAVGLFFAMQALGLSVSEDSFTGHIVRTVLIISIFWAIFRAAAVLTFLFENFMKKSKSGLGEALTPFVNKGIKVIVIIVAISVIAKEWRYDLGALLAGLGLGGLAFALAAQETLANFFGGLTIMMDKPFTAGDWIETQSVEGTVEDIGFRSTKVRTFAQAVITVPNSSIAKAPITNWSRMGKRRITFHLDVKFQTTAAQMETLLQRIRTMLREHPEIHQQTIFVYFDAF